MKLKPDDFSAYKLRGEAYYFLQNYQEAIHDWNRALNINPNDTKIHKIGVCVISK
ncbi:MAG: tetratricopeptide repeat protein [Hydrococcus sp. SU_1_0]|nr:tetratricopeptide repeat protein [Hydrococcus sp. SU_1_0]